MLEFESEDEPSEINDEDFLTQNAEAKQIKKRRIGFDIIVSLVLQKHSRSLI